jgi:hypothetical protein
MVISRDATLTSPSHIRPQIWLVPGRAALARVAGTRLQSSWRASPGGNLGLVHEFVDEMDFSTGVVGQLPLEPRILVSDYIEVPEYLNLQLMSRP